MQKLPLVTVWDCICDVNYLKFFTVGSEALS